MAPAESPCNVGIEDGWRQSLSVSDVCTLYTHFDCWTMPPTLFGRGSKGVTSFCSLQNDLFISTVPPITMRFTSIRHSSRAANYYYFDVKYIVPAPPKKVQSSKLFEFNYFLGCVLLWTVSRPSDRSFWLLFRKFSMTLQETSNIIK